MDSLRAPSHLPWAADLHREKAEMSGLPGSGPLPQRGVLPEWEDPAVGAGQGEESEGKDEAQDQGEARDEAGGEAQMSSVAKPGTRAPDFNLPLVGGGYRGLRDLLDPGGGVLVFFKEDCPASELVVPRLGPLAEALRKEERFFLAIAEDSEEAARAFRDRNGIRFPIAWEAPPYPASRDYAIGTVPALFVVDGAGYIAERV
ncbi:MAG: redoxin domain-containing protein, partial [Candidatus Eisenbacteria bacterium]